MTRPTHVLSLNCTVSDVDAWDSVWNQFSAMASRLGGQSIATDINVSSEQIPDETDFDEQTLFKVSCGLREAGLTETQVVDAISAMQNNGVLFRERSR